MSLTEKTPEYAKPALHLGAFLISLVGGILFMASEFGWWYGAYSWGYDFALYGEFTPWYGKIILIILGLLYLFVAFVSLYKLYPFITLDEAQEESFEKGAFYSAIAVVILTIITAIVFAIMASEGSDWGFGTTFYTGLLGGIITILLLMFAKRLENQ
jgi:hypothetical protein